MTRPRYESQQDRDNESLVQKKIESWARCSLTKLGTHQYLDWEARRGDTLVALIEYKKRSNPRLQYPTYMVAKKKIDRGIYQSCRAQVPFLFVVEWTDGLHYLIINQDTPMSIGQGGRRDRGDSFDVEQMCYFDTSLFKLIPE